MSEKNRLASLFRKKKTIVFIVIIILIIVIYGLYRLENQPTPPPEPCKWEISQPQEYRDQYINYDGSVFKWYGGTVYNRDARLMHIKGFIVRVFDKDNILIGNGYTPMNTDLRESEGVKYGVNVIVGKGNAEALGGDLRFDAYPDISSCR